MKELWLIDTPPPLEPARRKRRHWRRVGFAYENKDGSWTLNISELPRGRERVERPRTAAACSCARRELGANVCGRGFT